MPVNQAKLDKLKAQGEGSRIGGKGTARRKKKVVHKTATDDKKLQVGSLLGQISGSTLITRLSHDLQNSLRKLSVNAIQGIEEVNMIKDDGRVLHFVNPKVQASLTANTFAISGQCEDKRMSLSVCLYRDILTIVLVLEMYPTYIHTHTAITDLLPGIFNQLVSSKVLCVY